MQRNSGMSLTDKLQIEDTHEFKVLLTNDPKMLSNQTLNELIGIIAYKTRLNAALVQMYVVTKMQEATS